jgi:hypothetical protein
MMSSLGPNDPIKRAISSGFFAGAPVEAVWMPAGHADPADETSAEIHNMSERLPKLVRNAGNLRCLARQYRNEARARLHDARIAREYGDQGGVREGLSKARQARSKALRCDSFARLCENRAATMSVLAGFSPLCSRRRC